MEETKPKRTLSPEALQKLQLARKKALEAKRQNKEITKFEKEQIKQEKQQKREKAYNTIMEMKQKEEEVKEQPKKSVKPKIKEPEPEPEPEPEEETEEEPEEEEEEIIKTPPKKIIPKTPITPQKQFKKKTIIPTPRREATNEELYDNANIEILRHRLYQQTRQRLQNDLFGY
jgi:hypothetical protein